MLTSSSSNNQYLRPEYLTPLPTTLDAKNSPLALLAQTCSAIGADTPNPKLLANIEKSSKTSHKMDNRDKSSPGSHSSSLSNGSSNDLPKSSFKPYESCTRDKTSSPDERSSVSITRMKTPKLLSQPLAQIHAPQPLSSTGQMNGRCGSNHSATSGRMSPACIRKTPQSNPEKSSSPQRASSKESSSMSVNTSIDNYISAANALKDSIIASSASATKTSSSIPVSSAPAFMSGYPGPGLPYAMDLMTASALMSPHHAMLKAAALNPYLNYARMKMPGDQMMSMCRDPYCTGCALSPHMMGKSGASCPAGCTQCDHPAAKAYASQTAAYAHAQLAALAAASQLPYICNWIAGDAAYCGKRFGTSDELLQHLRTHTSSMPESMFSPAAAAAAAAGLPPSHPLFQRTYPTPPLSPLSTARYHPYNKPSLLPPSLSQSSPLMGYPLPPHPSLAQYFSPYSLYSPRLGTSPSTHP